MKTTSGLVSRLPSEVSYLIVQSLDFIEQRFGAEDLCVVLFEVNALVVQRLQVILLILLPPDLVEASLGFPPFLLFYL